MRFGPAATAFVLLGLALILPACGDEQTTAAGGAGPDSEATVASGPGGAAGASKTTARPAAARRCVGMLGGFLDAMESLGNTLAVGLDYESYLGAVNHVRGAYASVAADRLPLTCLALVGGPAERALNVYIDAANTWGDCLATASCDPESVEPRLQRGWEEASDLLAEARGGLRKLD
jgi:hypothetical protein